MNTSEELLEAKKALVNKICKDFGIDLSVSGCGCCGSPNFKFKFNGKEIFDESDADSLCFSTDGYKEEEDNL